MKWNVEAIDAHRSITVVLFIHTELKEHYQVVLNALQDFYKKHIMCSCNVYFHCLLYDKKTVYTWNWRNKQDWQMMNTSYVKDCLMYIGTQFIKNRQLGKPKGDWRPIVLNIAKTTEALLNEVLVPFIEMHRPSTVLYATEGKGALVNSYGNAVQLTFSHNVACILDYTMHCLALITAPGAVKDYTKNVFKKSLLSFDELNVINQGDEM